MSNNDQSRRVYFVSPPSVVQDQLIDLLIQAEFEVALVTNSFGIYPLVKHNPHCIFFLNDEAQTMQKDKHWPDIIDEIRSLDPDRACRIGVLGYNTSTEMAQYYLMEKEVECGYVQLKLGLAQTAKILLTTLEANEAKGRRKYIRVKGIQGKSSISLNTLRGFLNGEVIDISSAGLAVVLQHTDQLIQIGTSIDDMQLRLWGALCSASGKVMGHRQDEKLGTIHVILFDPPPSGQTKMKIHNYVRKVIQHETDGLSKA
jgi:hypothetical protein